MQLDPITFLLKDTMPGPRGQRRRFAWPWRKMLPDDKIDIIAPSKFIPHVRSTALSYARPDGATKLVAKVVSRHWDEEQFCWVTTLRVIALGTGMPVALPPSEDIFEDDDHADH